MSDPPRFNIARTETRERLSFCSRVAILDGLGHANFVIREAIKLIRFNETNGKSNRSCERDTIKSIQL